MRSAAAKMIMVSQCAFLVLAIIVPINGLTVINSDPPPHEKVAEMARYIIHNTNWISVATISQVPDIRSYPFVNLESMSDGPVSNSTGVPYLYITPLDFTGIDIVNDTRCTIMASLAQLDYCEREDLDPQDPRCAKVIISGHLVKVVDESEHQFAKDALFSRHPAMKKWPIDHNWYIAKIDIELIVVRDYFRGAQYVSKEDYFNVHPSYPLLKNLLFEDVNIVE